MFEWFQANPKSQLRFECVEIDDRAIEYAKKLNAAHLKSISFKKMNVLHLKTDHAFSLIWAAGIFDYFSDRVFVSLARRFYSSIAPGGSLVIGNFSKENKSQPYMEVVGNWRLNHRSAEDLITLLSQSGIPTSCIKVESESEGVNLFVHATRVH